MKNFLETLHRLKGELGFSADKEVAAALGMSPTALNQRKARDSFPEKELRALIQQKPELGIDVDYVLTGHRREEYEASSARADLAPLTTAEERLAGVCAALSPSSRKAVLQVALRLRELEVMALDGRPLQASYQASEPAPPMVLHDAPRKGRSK